MATYTDNYHLEKPAQSDLYNIDVFNGNSDIIDASLGDKAENQSLAPVESSATASRNYSVGQQFVYNGLLYEATAAIASGGTITPGSNCARTTVAEELSALNDSLKYTFLGEYTGTDAVPLPAAWKEAYVCLLFPWNPLYGVQYPLIREQADNPGGQLRFTSGYYTSASDYGSWVLEFSNGNLYIVSVQRNGTNQASTAKLRVWYR